MTIIAILALLVIGYALTKTGTTIAEVASAGNLDTSAQNSTNDSGVSVYSSDGSLTGSPITNDPSTWPGGDAIYNICAAVAMAEGYNLGDGSAPYDLNNPGDLSPGDEASQDTCGGAQQHGGSAIIVFCTAEGGWTALHTKFANIVGGRSSVYPPTWTWTQIAQKYAGNWSAWLNNVTSYLGVDANSTPGQYLQSNPTV